MRSGILALVWLSLFSLSGAAENIQLPHLDLETSSTELRELLKSQPKEFKFKNALGQKIAAEPSIDRAIQIGERLLSWVDLINSNRTPDKQIHLTSPGTRKGIPITAPSHYSPRTVEQSLNSAEQKMPTEMSSILFSASKLPPVNPISDEDFAIYGRLVDRVYQTAARWRMLIPYKYAYISNRAKDIRGYYYLTTNHWDVLSLQNWSNLSTQTQSEIREAFIGTCMNSRSTYANCKSESDAVDNAAKAITLYQKYMPRASQVYDGFFAIQNARRDINWSAKSFAAATIPFFDPVRADVRHFIQHNIEEEFSWLGWGLKINFVDKKPAPYVVFIPGQTANVEGLGGNKIEMDANKSLNEYEEQWTIRHEFGHVLGLPDCYHEFYDATAEEFINYQIDVTDLMCSRAGNMSQRIYDQLQNTYMK